MSEPAHVSAMESKGIDGMMTQCGEHHRSLCIGRFGDAYLLGASVLCALLRSGVPLSHRIRDADGLFILMPSRRRRRCP